MGVNTSKSAAGTDLREQLRRCYLRLNTSNPDINVLADAIRIMRHIRNGMTSANDRGLVTELDSIDERIKACQVVLERRLFPGSSLDVQTKNSPGERALDLEEIRRREVRTARGALAAERSRLRVEADGLKTARAALENRRPMYQNNLAPAGAEKVETPAGKAARLTALSTTIDALQTQSALLDNLSQSADEAVLDWYLEFEQAKQAQQQTEQQAKQQESEQVRIRKAKANDPRLLRALETLGSKLKVTLSMDDESLGGDVLLNVDDLAEIISDTPVIADSGEAGALSSYLPSARGDGVTGATVREALLAKKFPDGELLEIAIACIALRGDAAGHGGRIKARLPIVLTHANTAGFNVRNPVVLQFLDAVTVAWTSGTTGSNSDTASGVHQQGEMTADQMQHYAGKGKG